MHQFLNFLPLPHGQGSLRPTFSDRLRIGSIFCSPWLLSMADCCCWPIAVGGGASSWTAAVSFHVEPTKLSSSCSMRKIRSVTRSPMLVHMVSKVCIPSRLYSTLGSIWAYPRNETLDRK